MRGYSLVQGSRRNGGGRKGPFLVVLVLLLLAVGGLLLFSAPLRGALIRLVSPLWGVQEKTSTSGDEIADAFSSKEKLMAEIALLRNKITESDIVLRRFRVLEEENTELKRLLGRQVYESGVLAAVLGRPAITPYDTLIIDVGENAVRVGDRVVVEGSIVLGTVSEVYEQTTQVLLFSAPGVETQVLIGPERVPVTARGQGGGSFVAEFPREAHVEEGYTVVLPGINPYLFSTVESTVASPSDAFITVRFKNPINFQALTWVQVLTDSRELPPAAEQGLPPVEQGTTTTSGNGTTSNAGDF